VSLAFLVLALLLYWPMTSSIASTVPNGGGDVYQTMWNLWWVGYALLELHTSIYFTNMLYFPVGASLVTQTLSPLAGIIALPFQAVSLPFEYNVIFFVDFMLSGLFMYMLAYHVVGNKYAAFVAGIIFAFSPMHIAQSLGHLNWTSIEFVPLFILLFILTIEKKKVVYPIAAALSFVFVVFFGDPEQGVITAVFATLLLIYYAASKKRSEILNRKFATNLAVMIVLVFILGSPFIVPIIRGIQNGALSQAAQLSGLQYNMLWSDPLASFFLPSPDNALLRPLANSYMQIYSVDPTERISYLGYVAIFLMLYGLYYGYKKKDYSVIALWTIVFAIFAWLSLGPYLQVGPMPNEVGGLPEIYLLYRSVPVLSLIREPGRFDMITTVALAILAAFGFKELMAKLDNGKHSKNYPVYITSAFVFFILLEYSGFFAGSGAFITPHIPKVYYEIGNLTGNYTVLVLPATTNGSRATALYLGMQMYYQTAFKKPIITGYTSRTTPEELLPQETLPLVQAAAELESTGNFTYSSPIKENYTNLTIMWLYNYNTRFVSVIRQAYSQYELEQLAGYLYSVFGTPVYDSNTTIVFSTQSALYRAGSSFVAYPGPSWYPGWYMCYAYGLNCNSTIGSLWFGSNIREIVAYSPRPLNYTMSFKAFAPTQTSLSIYLNGYNESNMVAEMQLIGQQNESQNLHLQQGYNFLVFYAPNSTGVPPYMDFGIGNVSFAN